MPVMEDRRVDHSDPTITELCPICNPRKAVAKVIRGKAFFEHVQQAYSGERAAFFEMVRTFLVEEKLL